MRGQAGRWHRDGNNIVIDVDGYGGTDAGAFEFEVPGGPPTRPPAARRLSLTDARKELKACLKDMKALKSWADPGNQSTAPFVDAFSSAIANGRASAPSYTAAVQALTVPTHATRDQARKNLQDLLEDMDALREWADPSMAAWAPFSAAFTAVRAKARQAADVYAATLGRP